MNSSDREIANLKEQDKLFLEINQKAFKELLTFVDFADDKLNIAFAEINFAQDRDLLIKKLIKHPSCKDIQFEILDLSDSNLRFVRDELIAALKNIKIVPDKKLILLITGLEKSIGVVDEYPEVLVNLNYVRDDLSKTVSYPIIFCLPEYALTRLAKYAPDFWAWKRKVFCFKSLKNQINIKNGEILSDKNIDAWKKVSDKRERVDLLLRLLKEQDFSQKSNLPNIFAIYGELSVSFFYLGDYQQTIYYGKKLLNLQKELGDRHGQAYCSVILGNAYDCLGEPQKAIDLHEQALYIAREFSDLM